MIVTFISQCEKNSLKKTRRILDAFANRIGDNVWQTNITKEGLKTVHRLLSKDKPSKNTAVACHRIATRHRTELLWVVGNKRKFNELGYVPVNRTKRNIRHSEWENDWRYLSAIQLIAILSALFHDIGKSSIGFQKKLEKSSKTGDPYRHEWISLKLFVWLIQDCQTDNDVFERLMHIDEFLKNADLKTIHLQSMLENSDMDNLPPISAWMAWLIVSHHRLPPLVDYHLKDTTKYLNNKIRLNYSLYQFYKKLEPKLHWVKNNTETPIDDFINFKELVMFSPAWQKQVKRYAKKAQNDVMLRQLSEQYQGSAIADPFLLMLSRLSLMVGDHNYSSLKPDDKARVAGDKAWQGRLIANTFGTSKHERIPNQSLDEHLLGVADFTAKFGRTLPVLHENLPKLADHDPLAQNTNHAQFLWQNKAFKLALAHSQDSRKNGFFGVNMASTGKGKTICNARIMYALAHEQQGVRLTIALGLRILTLQTGQSFRKNLSLTDNELAVLVGGLAQKQLFEEQAKADNQNGSESAETLIDEYVDGGFDEIHDCLDDLNLGTVIADDTARKLLGSPVVVCTIDHLMQASECKRGGRYIVPLLRLFSGDLVLDEPDDFDQSDLPALSRLVHLAGLFGSRVLLSSATLPPDLLHGLFKAYLAGRTIYNEKFGLPRPDVVCAWFDENHCTAKACDDFDKFTTAHQAFIKKRLTFLGKQAISKQAEILPLPIKQYKDTQKHEFFQDIATSLLRHAIALHDRHHLTHDGKTVSVGLVRMANIQPLIKIAKAMHTLTALDGVDDVQFYVCCYHSRQVLLLRNVLERRLDTLLARKDVSDGEFVERADIANHIAKHPNKSKHIFIVLATPVAEVGRDHDYDWAMVEPSSMRSVIQLAGRVWRHRTDKVATTPNIAIWQHNIRALQSPNGISFTKPGFENSHYKLDTHDINLLINQEFLQKIDAKSRIQRANTLNPSNNLADLEHQVLHDLMNNDDTNVVNAYWRADTANRSHVHLSVLTPFRAGRADVEYIIKPDGDGFDVYHSQNVKEFGFEVTDNQRIRAYHVKTDSPFVDVWLDGRLSDELAKLSEKLPNLDPDTLIKRFATIAIMDDKVYEFDERFGAWVREK